MVGSSTAVWLVAVAGMGRPGTRQHALVRLARELLSR
jgi:hypothetical protein